MAEDVPGFQGQLVVPFAQFAPPPREQFSHPINRCARTKPRSGIECAGPVETILKATKPRSGCVVAMTDHRGLKCALLIFTRPKEAGAFRCTNPFMEVAGVISRRQLGKIQWQ